MPSTHTSLYYHIIFSTKERRPIISDRWRQNLYSYIGGILRRIGAVAQEIGGTADHIHILASLGAAHRLSDVLREVKSVSCGWVRRVVRSPYFSWQDGYGAFTVSPSQIEFVETYIRGQQEHHRRTTFQEEYRALLVEHGIEFDEDHLW